MLTMKNEIDAYILGLDDIVMRNRITFVNMMDKIYEKNGNIITDEGLQKFLDTLPLDKKYCCLEETKSYKTLVQEISLDGSNSKKGQKAVENYLYKDNLFNDDMQYLLNSLKGGRFNADALYIRTNDGKYPHTSLEINYSLYNTNNDLISICLTEFPLTKEQSEKLKSFIKETFDKEYEKDEPDIAYEEYEPDLE